MKAETAKLTWGQASAQFGVGLLSDAEWREYCAAWCRIHGDPPRDALTAGSYSRALLTIAGPRRRGPPPAHLRITAHKEER